MFGERSSDAARASFSSRARLSGIGLERRRQELQRDRPPEADVFGAIHLAHAACAELAEHAIVTELAIDHRRDLDAAWCCRARSVIPQSQTLAAMPRVRSAALRTEPRRTKCLLLRRQRFTGRFVEHGLPGRVGAERERALAGDAAAVLHLERHADRPVFDPSEAPLKTAGRPPRSRRPRARGRPRRPASPSRSCRAAR